jgi:hypothetical protein
VRRFWQLKLYIASEKPGFYGPISFFLDLWNVKQALLSKEIRLLKTKKPQALAQPTVLANGPS